MGSILQENRRLEKRENSFLDLKFKNWKGTLQHAPT